MVALCVAVAFGVAPSVASAEPAAPSVALSVAPASIVLESSTGRVLSASNAYLSMAPASTTKILTAITVLKHVDVNRTVEVSAQAAGVEGSSIYLKAGEKWTVLDLLYGLMLRSGNDAAVQLALTTAGSVEAFATLMNDVAYRAGAFHSHFANPHGLHDARHYTTAYDLAAITAYAMRDPLFRRIVATKTHTFTQGGERRTFVNKNKMLSGYEGAVGVKTGYTKAAGRCLVSAAERDGMRLVAVVLHEYDMWYRSADLLDAAFAKYRMAALWQAGEARTVKYLGNPTPVTVRETARYPLSAEEAASLRWSFVMEGKKAKGDCLGEAFAYLGDRLIYRGKVYSAPA